MVGWTGDEWTTHLNVFLEHQLSRYLRTALDASTSTFGHSRTIALCADADASVCVLASSTSARVWHISDLRL